MKSTSPAVGRAPIPVHRLGAIALAGIVGLATGAAHAQQAGSSASPAPHFAVGDSWTYLWHDALTAKEQRIDETVKAVNQDGSIDVTINGVQGMLSADGNVVKSSAGSYSPAEVKLRFPLRVGEDYSAQYDYHDSTGRNWTRRMDAKVEGSEVVQTKAGTFETLRVRITGGWYADGAPGGGGSFEETMWYAPQARRFVKDVFRSIPRGRGVGNTTQTELVAYTVQP